MTGTGEQEPLERLRVFVASPSDVAAERGHVKTLADELNRGVAARAGFVLEVVRWETHSRPDMGRAQQLISDQVGQCEIFVGIMWRRFGQPTGVAGSGTEEEFNAALSNWRRTGQPRMLCYFSRARSTPPETVEEAEQLLQVTRFRAAVDGQGIAWRYNTPAEFKDFLREHLQQVLLSEFAGRRPPLDRNLLALLDVEKERCRDRDLAFTTANLLLALLGPRTGAARRVFDRACPGAAEPLVAELRGYEPRDDDGSARSFDNFDWYDRADVQAARRLARQQAARVIDARHLLAGFLGTPGQTRSALLETIGTEGYARLVSMAQEPERFIGTPGIRERLAAVPSPPNADQDVD